MTRYEIAARHPDGRALLIGYTPRLSRRGLVAAMQRHGEDVIRVLGIGAADEIAFATRPTIHAKTGAWWIGFTGRTQLDARREPLPFFRP